MNKSHRVLAVMMFLLHSLLGHSQIRHEQSPATTKAGKRTPVKHNTLETSHKQTPAVAPPKIPEWADAATVSMLIFEKPEEYGVAFREAEWLPVENSRDGEFFLLGEGSLPDEVEREAEFSSPPGRMALVRIPMPDLGPVENAPGKIALPGGKPVVEVLGVLKDLKGFYEEIQIPGEEARVFCMPSHQLRWIQLGAGNKVLELSLTRMEGYAGGGAQFNATILLDLKDGVLRRVAAFPTGYDKLLAGSWNPDGTREHFEEKAEWRLRVPRSKVRWPTLHLVPRTPATSGARLYWNRETESYDLVPEGRRDASK